MTAPEVIQWLEPVNAHDRSAEALEVASEWFGGRGNCLTVHHVDWHVPSVLRMPYAQPGERSPTETRPGKASPARSVKRRFSESEKELIRSRVAATPTSGRYSRVTGIFYVLARELGAHPSSVASVAANTGRGVVSDSATTGLAKRRRGGMMAEIEAVRKGRTTC